MPSYPAYQIMVGSLDITSRIRPFLLELRLLEKPGDDADTVDLTIDNRDYEIAPPPDAAPVSISIGYDDSGIVYKGSFFVSTVTAQEAPSQLVVTCSAPKMASDIKSQRNKTWENSTFGEIYREIARRNGLTPVIDAELASAEIPLFHQNNESDFHTIRRLARRHDAVGKITDGKLVAVKRGNGQSAGGQAMGSFSIVPEGLLSWRCVISEGRTEHRSVVAHWKDHETPERHKVEMTGSQAGVQGRMILPQIYQTELEAVRAAQTRVNELNRGKSSLEFECIGLPDYTVNAIVTTSGFPDGCNKRWTINQVEHTISSKGYLTKVTCEMAQGSQQQG